MRVVGLTIALRFQRTDQVSYHDSASCATRESETWCSLDGKRRIFRGEGGERGRNRTYNLLIKSQLLCQLSYAPARLDSGWPTRRGNSSRADIELQCRAIRCGIFSAIVSISGASGKRVSGQGETSTGNRSPQRTQKFAKKKSRREKTDRNSYPQAGRIANSRPEFIVFVLPWQRERLRPAPKCWGAAPEFCPKELADAARVCRSAEHHLPQYPSRRNGSPRTWIR